ncbi:nitroreductase family protein [Allokutzneria sp. A3M-2-11 16]|uniref:nitroreductase family protein n=1 Tax=Allokutzneria sp. A3M-2-11 16 TaxID=2962043 RepID=UPI0020B823E6|nr:nitroreductase family protein [Allokutzneria sp. A3M-2-11 16]MCP3799831.1 nitroreductase family protein [Allokutzneria sp. A3M-2-11 16]
MAELSAHRPAESSAPLHELIRDRWSPRVLDPKAEITEDQLRALFEAARWAASWGNSQPARYLVGRRGDDTFERIYATLTRGNKNWAGAAGALVLGIAVTRDDEGEPMPYAEYGFGLATQNLVLQAVAEGLVAHQMAGFSPDAAKAVFELPEGMEPLVAIAIGHFGDGSGVDQSLIDRDTKPRQRKPLSSLVFGSGWGAPAF